MQNSVSTRRLADALAAIAHHEAAAQARDALQAAVADGALLAQALLDLLDEGEARAAYDQPAAFEAFIRGGDNVPLYEATSTALARLYDTLPVTSLLDIGCGDGMALIPALQRARHAPTQLDLVEPSPALLGHASEALRTIPLALDHLLAWPIGAQDFAASLRPEQQWDLAQSTFALQSLPPAERKDTLRRLRPHVRQLAVVEFDVPVLEARSAEYFDSLAQRYERALAGYGEDAPLVAGGFLAPMLLGQLRQASRPSNWEQPIQAWLEELREAGYATVRTEALYDYSWSPAVLMLFE
ncbi:SAM-dependent methyltransferase [Dyella sp. SG562]|uniref:class I SAM-dependent methyltransferase n=1 Tax=unclassified Dyella TaxID=2634549 RepID=UPI00141FF254|nr:MULTISPECIES: class I SAM-dependent methyltransferase [unclassified Dyella]NII75303.1 SAM-dependent methyltransferase [Dyella sp. SG562]NKJ23709.1 SAM-dependent methyltransferase [Dyella sp. SG609]